MSDTISAVKLSDIFLEYQETSANGCKIQVKYKHCHWYKHSLPGTKQPGWSTHPRPTEKYSTERIGPPWTSMQTKDRVNEEKYIGQTGICEVI